MSNIRYKTCYDVLLQAAYNGKYDWTSKLKYLLLRLGFGYVWARPTVGGKDSFIGELMTR